MFAEPRTWVDVESAVRAWARSLALPGVDERVFFGASHDTTAPQIVLQRIAGRDDDCLVQFDVWAGHKAQAAAIAAALATAADVLHRFTHEGVLLHGALVERIAWRPDPESDTPRYAVDVTFVATAAA